MVPRSCYAIFIYGINIPGAPKFKQEVIRKLLKDQGSERYSLVGIVGRRPDTLLVGSTGGGSPTGAAEWVEKAIGRPAVGREVNTLKQLYSEAVSMATEQFLGSFDASNCKVLLDGRMWKLGAVLANRSIPKQLNLRESRYVKLVGWYGVDSFVVLKREMRDSGTRIMWGEEANRLIREPMRKALGDGPVICTSRSMITIVLFSICLYIAKWRDIMDSTKYLRDCLEEFDGVSSQKHGKPFNFSAIEESVGHLRYRRAFTYEDVARFESEARRHWWFEEFWAFPPRERIERDLSGLTFNFWQLPNKNEEKVIGDLLKAFKSVEIVSIILRFVRPDHYGIISPPVERVLDVQRGSDAAQNYLNYAHNLRDIQEHYAFRRAADADMALWVLHEKCFGALQDEKIKKEYRTDPFMLQLRAENLVSPLTGLSLGWLAKALEKPSPDLAGVIACYRLEILIRQFAEASGLGNMSSQPKIKQVITQLCDRGIIDRMRKGQWDRLTSIRNGLFHEDREPDPKKRADLLKGVLDLELELERGWVNFKAGDKKSNT